MATTPPVEHMEITTWRNPHHKALLAEGPADINTRNWVIGDTITLTVVGIKRPDTYEGVKF